MASYSIGGLRVDLSMGTADFKKGAKEAQSTLASLTSAAKASATLIAAAFGSLLAATQDAARGIEEVRKAAAGLGVSTESLSRLTYAAKEFGLTAGEMQTALGALNKISDETKVTLDKLGVAYEDSEGDALSADEIYKNLAAAFGKYEDGVNKTATAVQIFGSDALGRQLVPALNQTAAAMKAAGEESDRLGKTVTADKVADAAAFAKAWDDMKDALARSQPVVTAIMQGMTALITKFGEWVTLVKDYGRQVGLIAREKFFDDTSKVPQITQMSNALVKLNEEIKTYQEHLLGLKQAQMARKEGSTFYNLNEAAISDTTRQLNELLARRIELENQISKIGKDQWSKLEETRFDYQPKPEMEAPHDAAKAKAQERAAEALRQFMTDAQPFENQFARITQMYKDGALEVDQYAMALERLHVLQSEMQFNEAISGTGKLASAMSTLFNNNKALAIAGATIDSYTAATAALKNPPGPPYTIPAAAAALAMGIANVRKIMQTNKGSGDSGGSTASMTSAGSAAASSASAGAAGGGGPMTNHSMYVQGLNPNDLLSGSMVAGIAQKLLDFQKDGGKVILGQT